jgi:uncharacterized protein with HEPN domain
MKPDKPTSKERVKHIIEAIGQIEIYTEGHSLQSFSDDNLTYSACLYQYTIIAEATGNIDPSILKEYDYPWRKVKDFRNFILHEYEGVDARIVWDTTRKILPELKNIMETILKKEF